MSANSVYELRRYRLRPGTRETLVDLFEREFIEPQEQVGMTIEAIYRSPEDPDAFIWIRSFPDMAARAQALTDFYTGPVWAKWADAANATMLNSDNVLLLSPAPGQRPFKDSDISSDFVVVTTCALAPGREQSFFDRWNTDALPLLRASNARIDAAFVTNHQPNTFPRLPVRAGEPVFVWVSSFADEEVYQEHCETLTGFGKWTDEVFPWLDRQIWRPIETLGLIPTARSRHGRQHPALAVR